MYYLDIIHSFIVRTGKGARKKIKRELDQMRE
jgi:hypothetical protein